MANRKTKLTPTEIEQAYEGLELDEQISLFKSFKLLLDDKKKKRQEELELLKDIDKQ